MGYDHDGESPAKGCVGKNISMPCPDAQPVCVGKARRNYVYKLVTPTAKPSKSLHAVCTSGKGWVGRWVEGVANENVGDVRQKF